MKVSPKKLITGCLIALLLAPMCTPFVAHAETNEEERTRIEAELAQVEQEIKDKEAELSNQKKQTGSIKKDLTTLQNEIAAKKLEIQKKNILLQRLAGQIQQKNDTINQLSAELSREKQSLARLLRRQNQLEQYSLAEVLLTGKTFSEFFEDIYTYYDLKAGLTHSFTNIRTIQGQTAEEKAALEDTKQEQSIVKVSLEKDKQTVEVKKKETDGLLQSSVKTELAYQQQIKDRKLAAAKLRARLFSLVEVKGGGIPFGDAVKLAKQAGELTGVRPEFLLAILKQETNIGSNLGSCYVTDPATGDGVTKSGKQVRKVMKPTRDVEPFQELLSALGKNMADTPVSCPIRGGGYGGAMGPSQFIPSTWALLSDRVGSRVGVSTPNPWIPLHAFTATALYVADLGADAKTYDAERNAACKYYSGRSCGASGVRNSFYGNSVMAYANQFADDINVLDSDN